MILKTILIGLLSLFFVLNGINHFYNRLTLEEYAHSRGLFSPKLSVKLAGILLLFGGISLLIPQLKLIGIMGLCVFLLVASFTIHSFWKEKEKDKWMLEMMNFAKNLAILTELLYIGFV